MATAAILIAMLFLLGTALGIVLLYINSRMRFVLFDSIVSGECRIVDYWRRRRAQALQYFVFQLLLLISILIGFAIILGIPMLIAFSLGWFANPRANLIPLILGGLVIGLLALILALSIAVVMVLTKDLVVPQIALENITATEGWRRLWSMIKQEPGGYAAYVGMKIVLAIAASVVMGLAFAAIVLTLLLPIGGVGFITVVLAQGVGLTWNPITIALAVVVGSLLAAALLTLLALIAVPAIVFFPSYSIYFFANRYAPLREALSS